MAWVVWVDDKTQADGRYADFGQAIGPFAKEADADKRAEEELRARKGKVYVQVTFLVYPEWVKPGERWTIPFEIIHLVDGKPEHRYVYGKNADGNDLIAGRIAPNLDDL